MVYFTEIFMAAIIGDLVHLEQNTNIYNLQFAADSFK